jgi:hypothetical protein
MVQKPKVLIQTDGSGKVAGTMSVFGLNQRVRAPVSEESRLATAITRRIGACDRCFKNKIRVRSSSPPPTDRTDAFSATCPATFMSHVEGARSYWSTSTQNTLRNLSSSLVCTLKSLS